MYQSFSIIWWYLPHFLPHDILQNHIIISYTLHISRVFYFAALFSMLGKYLSISLQVIAISAATLLSNEALP